jgi:Protein of unknown function (DUF3667)
VNNKTRAKMANKLARMAATNRETCRNCGNVLTGAYCATCGQPERDGHPPTIGHFFHDLIHEIAHVDGKIFRTLQALFFQPGKLTEEYRAGRVYSSVRPIRLFLTIVALQALVSSGQGPLNHQVRAGRSAATGDLSVNIASDLLRFEDQEEHVPASEQELSRFSHEFEKVYGRIRYSSVFVFAVVSWLIYRRREPYFVRHLVAGLHFYSVWYAIALLAGLPARVDPVWNDLTLLSALYLFFALRRLFRERWYVTMAKTAALYSFVFVTELGLGYAVAKWIEQ